jgi:hypothetical protein
LNATAFSDPRTGFVGVRVLTPEEIVEANENGKKVIVQLAFYSVFTILLSVCALYRRGRRPPTPCSYPLSRIVNPFSTPLCQSLPILLTNPNTRSVALGPSTYSFRQALQTSTFDSEIP